MSCECIGYAERMMERAKLEQQFLDMKRQISRLEKEMEQILFHATSAFTATVIDKITTQSNEPHKDYLKRFSTETRDCLKLINNRGKHEHN